MLNIVLFGPPGAGKGTQAAKLIEKYGFHHISTGEVIREEIRQESPLGRSMKSYIDKGHLAPDSLWGFGSIFGRWHATELFCLGIAFYIVQVVFSRIWLTYFKYGPLEWFWRSATYLKWQPFRK